LFALTSSTVFPREILFSAIVHSMPRTAVDIDRFREEIQKRLFFCITTRKKKLSPGYKKRACLSQFLSSKRCKRLGSAAEML